VRIVFEILRYFRLMPILDILTTVEQVMRYMCALREAHSKMITEK